jgi:glutathione synthase/RimK-type ligase-like ATP-grasp enzyme
MPTLSMPRRAPIPAPVPADRPLLIAGGDADPNIHSLLHRARERELPVLELLSGPERTPALTWDVQADTLRLDGREVRPAAGFMRYDVFHAMADRRAAVSFRAQAWYTALHGWLLAHGDVRMVNRAYAGQVNKPFMLRTAADCGLRIPRTLITNELDALERLEGAAEMIAKPVPGGGFTQMVGELLRSTERRGGQSAAPAIVQQRLVSPEVRIYGVGGRFIPFDVISAQLDYRADKTTRVEPRPLASIDPALIAALARLMERLGMQYGAADFKTDAETGELVFLEINSGPMFVAFDRASGYAVSDVILDWLTAGNRE